MLDSPGDRGDVGIPGPNRFVAMAVETGAFRQCPRFRAVPVGFADDGGIGVRTAVIVGGEVDVSSGWNKPTLEAPWRAIVTNSSYGRICTAT